MKYVFDWGLLISIVCLLTGIMFLAGVFIAFCVKRAKKYIDGDAKDNL